MGSVAVLFNVNAWLVTLAFFAVCLAAAVLTLGIFGYTSGLTGGRSLVATAILSLIVTAVVFVNPEGARRAAVIRTSRQLIDVDQPDRRTDLVYPKLIQLLGL